MPDSGWSILANVLAFPAAGLLLWALFADGIRQQWRRMKGEARRRRCPKCWYDLRRTPGRRCSECGYTATRERQLLKARKSRRGIAFALILFVASYACIAGPRITKRGWIGAVPTTGLVIIAPSLEGDAWPAVDVSSFFPAPGKPPDLLVTDRLILETFARMDGDELYDWQWRVAIGAAARRYRKNVNQFRAQPKRSIDVAKAIIRTAYHGGHFDIPSRLRGILTLPTVRIHTRESWPVGVPIYGTVKRLPTLGAQKRIETVIRFDEPSAPTIRRVEDLDEELREALVRGPGVGMAPPWNTFRQQESFGASGTPQEGIHAVLSVTRELAKVERVYLGSGDGVLRWARRIKIPCRISGAIDDILTGVESERVEQMLVQELNPVLRTVEIDHGGGLYRGEPALKVNLWSIRDLLALRFERMTFAVRFELARNHEVVATAAICWPIGTEPTLAEEAYRFLGSDSVSLDLRSVDDVVLDQLSRDGAWTLRIVPDPELALRNFDCDRYWKGEVTVPLRWDASAGD